MGFPAHVLNPAPAPAPHGGGAAHDHVMDKNLRDLRPIVTNLSSPEGAWVRVELALLISGKPDPKLEPRVAEFVTDATDFLRGSNAQQLMGANGLRRLREDLLERARFRIGQNAEAVLIQTLVVQ